MMRYACNNWSGLVLDNELAAGVWGRCGCCELSASRGSFGPSQSQASLSFLQYAVSSQDEGHRLPTVASLSEGAAELWLIDCRH